MEENIQICSICGKIRPKEEIYGVCECYDKFEMAKSIIELNKRVSKLEEQNNE